MGLFTRSRTVQRAGATWAEMIPPRGRITGGRRITEENALRQSAVWAALRVRADILSTLPVDLYRQVGEAQVEVPKAPFFLSPSTDPNISFKEWMYSSQVELDRTGNSIGIIRARDGNGRPAKIDLVTTSDVVVQVRDDVISYRIKGTQYTADDIWHERQFTIAGLPVGLSPIAYAAWSLGMWQSAMEFGTQWFSNNGHIPSGILQNNAKVLQPGEAAATKERYKASMQAGDIFVVGKDWDFDLKSAQASDAKFLELQKYSDVDAVRFFGVPADLIEVDGNRASITYANVTQRNLQFLIINMGPAIARREDALSKITPSPRFVKLNSDAMLRMDPKSTSDKLIAEVSGRITAPSEARALMNRAPFTDEQLAEFDRLFPRAATPQKTTTIGVTE